MGGNKGMVRKSKKVSAQKTAQRNIGKEILSAIRDIKAGRSGSKYKIKENNKGGQSNSSI